MSALRIEVDNRTGEGEIRVYRHGTEVFRRREYEVFMEPDIHAFLEALGINLDYEVHTFDEE